MRKKCTEGKLEMKNYDDFIARKRKWTEEQITEFKNFVNQNITEIMNNPKLFWDYIPTK